MAVNVNLVGNVGKDPETKTFQNGGSVTSFTVGVSQGYFDKRNQWQDQGTMWLEVEPITQGAKSQLQYVHKATRCTSPACSRSGSSRATTALRAPRSGWPPRP